MQFDDDIAGEPKHEPEPVERDHGVFIQGSKHADLPDDEGRDTDYGEDRDPSLWGKQIELIEEDEDDGLKLAGFPEDEIPDILDAMGDEASDALPESPNGTSATGSTTESDHGGFPERE